MDKYILMVKKKSKERKKEKKEAGDQVLRERGHVRTDWDTRATIEHR